MSSPKSKFCSFHWQEENPWVVPKSASSVIQILHLQLSLQLFLLQFHEIPQCVHPILEKTYFCISTPRSDLWLTTEKSLLFLYWKAFEKKWDPDEMFNLFFKIFFILSKFASCFNLKNKVVPANEELIFIITEDFNLPSRVLSVVFKRLISDESANCLMGIDLDQIFY